MPTISNMPESRPVSASPSTPSSPSTIAISATFKAEAVETFLGNGDDLVVQRHGRGRCLGSDVDDDVAVRLMAVRPAGHGVVKCNQAPVAGVGGDRKPAVLAQLHPAEADIDRTRRGDRQAVDVRDAEARLRGVGQGVDGGLLIHAGCECVEAVHVRCIRVAFVPLYRLCADKVREQIVVARRSLAPKHDDLAAGKTGGRQGVELAVRGAGRCIVLGDCRRVAQRPPIEIEALAVDRLMA